MKKNIWEYLLVEPYTIVKRSQDIFVSDKNCMVKPVLAGICGSDVLYFKGDKDLLKLQKRLPLIPLHEGVVRIMDDGQLGSVIPFQKCNQCYACENGMENLCQKSSYMGSTIPGLTRSSFTYPKDLIVKLPNNITPAIATLLEPLSIVYRMVQETKVMQSDFIAVIGNGLLGRLVIILLHVLKDIKSENLFLLGQSDLRLEAFSDICKTVNHVANHARLKDMENEFSIVVEAVGGLGMSNSLKLAISLVKARGQIQIFGLSDEVKKLNFTHIVNKGLTLQGFSRARYDDYVQMMKEMHKSNKLRLLLERVIDPENFVIRSEDDLMNAFHYVISRSNKGRVIVSFEEGIR